MSGENPFNDIWSNFNNILGEEMYDLLELYSCWDYTREYFDNFQAIYEEMNCRFQKIIENCGDYVHFEK